MILPNLWTQGQLFAFSAIDGTNIPAGDFVGTLCGDKIGIRFYTSVKRELIVVNEENAIYRFDAVTGDYLAIRYENDAAADIFYADRRLIVGRISGALSITETIEGAYTSYDNGGIAVHQTAANEFTALYCGEGRFVYAYDTSENEVLRAVRRGMTLDPAALEQRKLTWYQSHALDCPYPALYNKCLSVMKTQIYSPIGIFKHKWSTPDRLPHRKLWLWDSVFHAIGFRNIDPALAEQLILALFDVQDETGFIPHCADPDTRSSITQPPVIAWGALLVYQKSGNAAFLETVFEKNKHFLHWCRQNRRLSDRELYTWNTQSNVNCRCDESGMDNSPRFDIHKRLFAIDFSCFMANETRAMGHIADILGDAESGACFREWNECLVNDINQVLWCEDEAFYYDVIAEDGSFHKVASVASFLPLFAGVCNEDRAAALVTELQNPETFCTAFSVPSISKRDATFGSDMWRGPVWINYNYMIALGLSSYGYTALSEMLFDQTVHTLNEWYEKTGTLFEFYDCENRSEPPALNRKGRPLVPYDMTVKMQSIREYGWTTTLLCDILHRKDPSARSFCKE